jgi:DNA topoisomerase-1
MQLAQRLYEAGLITYMRTDSVNLSKEAMDAAQAEIIKSYGKVLKTTNQIKKVNSRSA